MSALGPAVAGVLSGTVAIALSRRRNRPPRWLRPSTSAAEGYASIRSALEAQRSYPLRHRILATLNERTASPAELAHEVALPVPSVSHHVDRLLADGAIEQVSDHVYRAVDRASHSDDAWAALSPEQRAEITQNNVDRMVTDLVAAAEGDGFQHRRSHQSWIPFELDERGFNEVAEVLERALDAILAIRDESDARIEGGEGEAYLDSEVVIAHFVRGRQEADQGGRERRA